MTRQRFLFFLLFPLLASFAAVSQPQARPFERVAISTASGERTYYRYCPSNAAKKAQPLILLLHGTGGNGSELVEIWQPLAAKEGIVLVAPTSSHPVGWGFPKDGPELLREVIDDAAKACPVDPRRLYLFGYSAGGDFALFNALVEARYFAAAVVVSAALRERQFPMVERAARKIRMALYAGTEDANYPIREVRGTREALSKGGIKLRYSEYPGVGHELYARRHSEINRDAWKFLNGQRLSENPVYRQPDEQDASYALRWPATP